MRQSAWDPENDDRKKENPRHIPRYPHLKRAVAEFPISGCCISFSQFGRVNSDRTNQRSRGHFHVVWNTVFSTSVFGLNLYDSYPLDIFPYSKDA
jgi:hypothetical protein